MLELMKNRRSIRKYKEEGITKEVLDQLLKVALLAPSSMNKKPVEMVVIEDKETMKALKKCKKMGTIGLDTAPLALVVIGDSSISDVWVEDASIVATLIQVEAEKLGLGSCWIQMRNRLSVEGADSEKEVRAVLDIPEHYGVLSIMTIGYKNEVKTPYDEESYDFSKVHYGKF